MDIEFKVEDVPLIDEQYLQINYSVDGSETDFGILVYNGTSGGWDDLGSQGDLTSTSYTTKEYNLEPEHILVSGDVRARFIGRNESFDIINSTLNIEYFRIRSAGGYFGVLGESTKNYFGWSVSNASDINQDGSYDDVIVGAPGYSNNKGRAYIFHGGNPPDAISDVNLTGVNNDDRFGFSVSSAGDIDGDGSPDLIIGVPYWDNGPITDCGQVLIFKGGSSMDITYDYVHNGTQANEHYGWSVSLSLTVEGGSINSVVVGSSHFDSYPDSGKVEVLNTVIPEYTSIAFPIFMVITVYVLRKKRKKRT
jgi:hypothetical protein